MTGINFRSKQAPTLACNDGALRKRKSVVHLENVGPLGPWAISPTISSLSTWWRSRRVTSRPIVYSSYY